MGGTSGVLLCTCCQTKQSFDVLMQKQVWVAVQKTVTGS